MTDNEYGHQESLEEILQKLVTYCSNEMLGEVTLKLALPEKVLENYSRVLAPIERFKLATDPISADAITQVRISKVYLNGGTVELL